MKASEETDKVMRELKNTLDNWNKECECPYQYLIEVFIQRAASLESQLKYVRCKDKALWKSVQIWEQAAKELKAAKYASEDQCINVLKQFVY